MPIRFPSLFFCVDVKHAHDLAAVLRSHGVRVYPVSGKTPDSEEQRFYRLFAAGEIDGLTSCSVLTEGADHPHAMGCFLARPTKSGLLYRQIVGRVLRPFPAPQGDRHYQQDCLAAILAEVQEGMTYQLSVLPTGCHAKGQGILMHDGSVKLVEDVAIGDHLMGPDSKPRTVLQLCRGVGPMVQVTPTKGTPFVVNDHHIMTLVRTSQKAEAQYKSQAGGKVIDICLHDYMDKSTYFKHIHKLFRTGAEFPRPNRHLPIPPYILGVLLGDGCITVGSGLCCNSDEVNREFIQYVCDRLQMSVSVHGKGTSASCFATNSKGKPNPLTEKLRGIGLHGHSSGNKFIPFEYKTASRHDRMELLAGIIDTDGSIERNKRGFSITTKSTRLADDIAFVCRSLGFAAYSNSVIKRCQTGASGEYYRVTISGNLPEVPCRIQRKVAKTRRQKKNVLRTGFKCRTLPPDEYYGFTLDGDGRYLMDDFTVTHNTGKTRIACQIPQKVIEPWKGRRMRRLLFLVHRDNLVQQAAAAFREHCPGYTVGVEAGGGRYAGDADVVVGSVQSLGLAKVDQADGVASFEYNPRLRSLRPEQFDAVIVDECFPPGTLIDGLPIMSIRPGDTVSSFDHSTNEVVKRPVVRVLKKQASRLLRITFSDGSAVACTPNHPFFDATAGCYTPAENLLVGGMVLCANRSYTCSHDRDVYELQRETGKPQRVQKEQAPEYRESILLNRVQQRILGSPIFGEDGTDQPQVCLRKNEGEESDEAPGGPREVKDHTASHGVEAASARRKRARPNSTTIAPGLRPGLGDREADPYKEATGFRISNLLSRRHRELPAKDRRGSGRVLPLFAGSTVAGSEEDIPIGVARVESIEVLEPGGSGEFERLCPEGVVYNLEVAENHNYFANGILVHNCHHAAKGGSYHNVLRYMRVLKGEDSVRQDCLLLCITATPNRSDNLGMEVLCDKISYEYPLVQAVKDGYLAPIRASRVETEVDISKVSTNRGDFSIAELEATVNTPERNELIAQEYLKMRDQVATDMSNIGPWRKPYAMVVDFVDIAGRHSLITAPTLFGLRADFDGKGKDIIEQSEDMQSIQEEHPGLDLQEATSMEDVRRRLESVRTTLSKLDLLRPPESPAEVRKFSKFTWLKEGEGRYHLGLLEGGMLSAREDGLGSVEVFRHKNGVRTKLHHAKDLKAALEFADKQVPDTDRKVLAADAAWRKNPPTEKQINKLWLINPKLKSEFKSKDSLYQFALQQHLSGNLNFSCGGVSNQIDQLTAARR